MLPGPVDDALAVVRLVVVARPVEGVGELVRLVLVVRLGGGVPAVGGRPGLELRGPALLPGLFPLVLGVLFGPVLGESGGPALLGVVPRPGGCLLVRQVASVYGENRARDAIRH